MPFGVRPWLPATATAAMTLTTATAAQPAIATAGMRRRSSNSSDSQPVISPADQAAEMAPDRDPAER